MILQVSSIRQEEKKGWFNADSHTDSSQTSITIQRHINRAATEGLRRRVGGSIPGSAPSSAPSKHITLVT